VEEASQLFADAGVPRAPRSITRFCQLGELDCMRMETEKNFKYLIDQNSVEKRIKQLQQALRFTGRTSPDMSSYVQTNNETSPDMSRHDEQARETETHDEEKDYLRAKVEELESENIHLKIDRAGKESFINQMAAERKDLISQLREASFELGAAKNQLLQLQAPQASQLTSHVQTADETVTREAEAAPSEPAPAPAASPTPEKRGFFGKIFG
jgi:hypothetical protein